MSPKSEKEEVDITQLEKYIYNTYIRVSRSRQNKPYKLRKDFTKFHTHQNYYYTKKLGIFLGKYSHISVDDFINAPYELYPDESIVYDLKFYTSPNAIKIYSLYMKQLDQTDPDTEYQLKFVQDSLMNIFKFCKSEKLEFNKYINHKSADIPTFLLHLKRREVSIYTLLAIEGFDRELNKVTPGRVDFTIGENFTSLLEQYRTRYYNSSKSKKITVQGIKYIHTLIDDYIKQI